MLDIIAAEKSVSFICPGNNATIDNTIATEETAFIKPGTIIPRIMALMLILALMIFPSLHKYKPCTQSRRLQRRHPANMTKRFFSSSIHQVQARMEYIEKDTVIMEKYESYPPASFQKRGFKNQSIEASHGVIWIIASDEGIYFS
jgi:hypothetical protein